MKTKISIPTPCNEDWNKMTPTEKGSYCKKCAFEVIDFTQHSPEEIREILKNRMSQKTCGHISKSQLDIMNSSYHLWENQRPEVFRSKFLYACLLVFGLSLFTGCKSVPDPSSEDTGIHDEEIVVGMIVEDSNYQRIDSVEENIEVKD